MQVSVINARFFKPLDQEMLVSLHANDTKMIVLEEASAAGSLGSSILEFYSEAGLYDTKIHIMGIPDEFIEHGSVKEQREEVGLTVQAVIEEMRKLKLEFAYDLPKTSTPS